MRTTSAVVRSVLAAAAAAAAATTMPYAVAAEPDPSPPPATTSAGRPADLDVLYVGAHPDDEAGALSTLGQWKQDQGVRSGVITVTRGEGGGNAVGPEEGPALGLLREREERSAVGLAGVTDIFNLDEVDFYYTVSNPLTRQIWDHEQVLSKVVRIVRQTRPEVLMTMNPAPTPGNHGNHQEAGQLAIEAFWAAADPTRFPEQISKEGLRPWAPAKVLRSGFTGTSALGPGCAASLVPTDPSTTAYGVWSGREAADGRSWAAVERDAQRRYASQGWAVFPDVPTDPNALGCDTFTLVASRVPLPEPGSDRATQPTAVLDGALVQAPGNLPLGTRVRAQTSTYAVQAGVPFTVTVRANAPREVGLGEDPEAVLDLPDGWTVSAGASKTDPEEAAALRAETGAWRETRMWPFTVTPPADVALGSRLRIGARLTSDLGTGWTGVPVEVSPPVTGTPQLLPQVADFEAWARGAARSPQLQGLVLPVLTLPSGGSREVAVTVANRGPSTASGSVALDLPAGFTAEPASSAYADLRSGAARRVAFTVTNTDASLPTSNQGGTSTPPTGDYAYTVRTTGGGATDTTAAALELVPTATIEQAGSASVVDGVESPGEYPGAELDLSRLWEGTACASAADCSATAKVAWHDDHLQVVVHVTDDVLSTRLATADCKRHWRVDSVELAFDPRGTAENTSGTAKFAIIPATAEGGPCYLRDADNHQGGPETAPGMTVASKLTGGDGGAYTGYTVETSIPMALLPAAIDPDRFAMDLFVYDSDTQDRTGQTRIGWSTWGGVQGDPYRWGRAQVEGYEPPADRPTTPAEPVIPLTALSSLDSPQSLQQAVAINVPLAGDPASADSAAGWVTGATAAATGVRVALRANASGTAHVTLVDASGTLASRTVRVAAGDRTVWVPTTRPPAASAYALVGWLDGSGGTLASRAPIPR